MAQANLSRTQSIDTTNDSIVIVDALEYIRGGRTLDVSGWEEGTIPAGHPIIYQDGEYKPIPLVEGEIDVAEVDDTVGILAVTVLKTNAQASIVVRGTVNPEAAVYAIPEECMAALPLIRFAAD